ncbi:mycobactin polyketide synthase MbtD [soil metagenome]
MSDELLPDGRIPVLLSAHSDELVRTDAAALLGYLDNAPDVTEVAAHLLRTRRVRRNRAVLRAADTDELAAGLRALIAGQEHRLVSTSALTVTPRIAFVFPGQGAQTPGMGADAYDASPVYRAEVDRCAAAFIDAGFAAPVNYLITMADPDVFSEIEVQGAQFVHAVALAAVWRAAGVVPDLTVGHSLGEVAAAYLAEMMTLAEAVAVLGARAGVVDMLPGDYAVAALGITAESAHQLIAATPGWLELSVINGDASVAVSGERAAVSAAVGAVVARGRLARELTVNFPVHTSVLDPLKDVVQQQLPDAQFTASPVQFIGSVTGNVVPAGTGFTEYWYQNLRSTVRFDRAVDTAIRCGATVFVELSTHPALLHAVQDRLDRTCEGTAVLVGSGMRGEPLLPQLSAGICAAAVADPGYRWRDRVPTPTGGRLLRDFPNAPMRATHFWAHPEPLPPRTRVTVAAETWLPAQLPVPKTVRRVAMVALGVDGPPAERIRAALMTHSGAEVVPLPEADLIVAVTPAFEDTDAASSAASLTEAIGSGLFDYLDGVGALCRDVWLLTAGGEQVWPSQPAALTAEAALAATHRSLGFAHPDQDFHHLDLPATGFDDGTAVVDIVLAGTGELAVREAGLFRRELADLGAQMPPGWKLESGVLDNVVITGGAGAIGMHYARYFAEQGAKRIVLLSRRSADPAALAELSHRHGVDIVSPRCDLTDRAQLAAVANEFAGGGASLLIHAAGTAAWDGRDQLTTTAAADTFAAKIAGLLAFDDLWPLRDDARMVLCSSVIGVWGGKDTVAYAGANRMLDVVAGHLRSRGRRCVAIRWGLWKHSGIVDAAETVRVQRAGLLAMAPELAIQASLYDYPTDPLVFDADPDRLARFLGSGQVHREPVTTSAPGDTPADVVRTELAAVLDIDDALTLDLDACLFDLGVDSLLALDLRKRMKQRTGQTVSLAILLGGITGGELIALLSDTASSPGTESTEGGILA